MNKSHKTILCVDDDDDDLDLICGVIKEVDESVNVLKATNGEEAFQMLRKAEALPCLILLDINMPVMGGKETLKKLREEKDYSKIQVVVFTTSSNPADEVFFSQFGVPVHTKPDKFQTMVSKVKTFLDLCN